MVTGILAVGICLRYLHHHRLNRQLVGPCSATCHAEKLVGRGQIREQRVKESALLPAVTCFTFHPAARDGGKFKAFDGRRSTRALRSFDPVALQQGLRRFRPRLLLGVLPRLLDSRHRPTGLESGAVGSLEDNGTRMCAG